MKRFLFLFSLLILMSAAASAQYAKAVDLDTLTVAASTADTSSWQTPAHFSPAAQDFQIKYKFTTISGTFDTITVNVYDMPEYSTSVTDWGLISSHVVTGDTTLTVRGQLYGYFMGDQIITDTTTKSVSVRRLVSTKER